MSTDALPRQKRAAARAHAAPAVSPAAAEPAPVSPGEHIYIASEDLSSNPAEVARTLLETRVLKNPVRRTGVELTLYDEGYLRVAKLRGRGTEQPYFLDLRFLDPVPRIERILAVRWLATALGCAATGALAAFLLRFDALAAAAAWGLGAAMLAAAVTLYIGVYASHETTEFFTLHGRIPVLTLVASLGSMKRFRAYVPMLSRSIEEAAKRLGTDTAAYLRAEMREHYRLRGDGVFDDRSCAGGTGRILAQFDVQL